MLTWPADLRQMLQPFNNVAEATKEHHVGITDYVDRPAPLDSNGPHGAGTSLMQHQRNENKPVSAAKAGRLAYSACGPAKHVARSTRAEPTALL